jgi:hypothetical protein
LICPDSITCLAGPDRSSGALLAHNRACVSTRCIVRDGYRQTLQGGNNRIQPKTSVKRLRMREASVYRPEAVNVLDLVRAHTRQGSLRSGVDQNSAIVNVNARQSAQSIDPLCSQQFAVLRTAANSEVGADDLPANSSSASPFQLHLACRNHGFGRP